LDNGKIIRNGYEVVPHGKTSNADRELFLTRNAKEFLSMIVRANEEIRTFAGHKDFSTMENTICTLQPPLRTVQKLMKGLLTAKSATCSKLFRNKKRNLSKIKVPHISN